MAFLYEKIDVLRENGYISNIPSYIPTNLNSAFELRPYQKTAFENFITHFESSKCPRPMRKDEFDLFFYKRAIAILDAIEQVTGKTVPGRNSDEVVQKFGDEL